MKPVIRHMSSFLNAPSLAQVEIRWALDMAVSHPVENLGLPATTALNRTNRPCLLDQHRGSLQPDSRIKILATSLSRPPDSVLKKSGGDVTSISPFHERVGRGGTAGLLLNSIRGLVAKANLRYDFVRTFTPVPNFVYPSGRMIPEPDMVRLTACSRFLQWRDARSSNS